ncbi:MAG: membrane or secreted protein [Flavobacteriales bacterium TMED123]|nr:MAG: membrane or secreted protein [Flavobacteriales bacterium TMED123]
MKIFLITIGMIALAFAGIAIKILLKKNGKFSGTCASQNPLVNKEGEACGLCGASPEEKCKNDEED